MEHTGYFRYIEEHVKNVKRAWHEQLRPKLLSDPLYENIIAIVDSNIESHDSSKYTVEEFGPYDAYFYQGADSEECNIDEAWLTHQNRNKHHWQYWVLVPDDSGITDTIRPLDMPVEHICEMVCDWHSFSATSTSTAYSWYQNRGGSMILSQNTRETVEYLVELLKQPLGVS